MVFVGVGECFDDCFIVFDLFGDVSLCGVCVVDDWIVWVIGVVGFIFCMIDVGIIWIRFMIEGGEEFDFCDVYVFDVDYVCVMVVGIFVCLYYIFDGG